MTSLIDLEKVFLSILMPELYFYRIVLIHNAWIGKNGNWLSSEAQERAMKNNYVWRMTKVFEHQSGNIPIVINSDTLISLFPPQLNENLNLLSIFESHLKSLLLGQEASILLELSSSNPSYDLPKLQDSNWLASEIESGDKNWVFSFNPTKTSFDSKKTYEYHSKSLIAILNKINFVPSLEKQLLDQQLTKYSAENKNTSLLKI